jgi:hypothetical protein
MGVFIAVSLLADSVMSAYLSMIKDKIVDLAEGLEDL